MLGFLAEGNDSELVSKVTTLLTVYIIEVLDCYKCLNDEDALGVSLEFLNEVWSSVWNVIKKYETSHTTLNTVVLCSKVAMIKSLSPLR